MDAKPISALRISEHAPAVALAPRTAAPSAASPGKTGAVAICVRGDVDVTIS
jgi:hypothetical protein